MRFIDFFSFQLKLLTVLWVEIADRKRVLA